MSLFFPSIYAGNVPRVFGASSTEPHKDGKYAITLIDLEDFKSDTIDRQKRTETDNDKIINRKYNDFTLAIHLRVV